MAPSIATVPFARVTSHVHGEIIGRQRPASHNADPAVDTTVASFPLGHMIGAVAFYGLVLLIAGRIERGLCLLVLVILGLVGHDGRRRGDVAGSYALGGLYLAFVALAGQRITKLGWRRAP